MADVGDAMATPTGSGGSGAGHAGETDAPDTHVAGSPSAVQRREEEDDDEKLEEFAASSDDEDDEAVDVQLDKAMMNELLLVCSNLGMLRVQKEGEAPVLMRGEDCKEWVHDLQRAIRRDHAKHKLVAKQLGRWKILQKKLLPLLVNHQHDWSLVFSILKVLVMLTMKPTRDSTNIAQQFKYLRQYKHEFLRNDIIPIMMSTLVEPLSRKGSMRTPQDYLNMEIVLTLIRNLLAIPNEDPRFVTSTTSHLSHLQEDFICSLHEESVYEMILLFAQDIDSAENREWNLLVMEMLDLTLDCSHPKSVVAYMKKLLNNKETKAPPEQPTPAQAQVTSNAAGSTPTRAPAPRGGGLLEKLSNEKMASSLHQSGSRRHSNFGGIMTMVGPTGRTTVLSDFSKTVYDQVPQAPKKPASRRRGKRSAAPITDLNEVFGGKGRVTESDEHTMRVLQEICDSIVSKSYFQLTNSLKTEFRRGSSKLVSTDRLQYFHLVWFLTTYHRLKLQALKSHHRHQVKAVERKRTELQNALDFTTPPPPLPEKPVYDEKAVLSTLDMFSFNFVLQSIENYATLKNYHGMTVSVQLLAEMMAYLAELTASDDPRFQRIADSLQHKIFYERDFLDRLPVLLKTWAPGQFSSAYVTDVVTLTHLVFKVLDAQGTIKVLSRRKAFLDKKKQKKKATDGESKGEELDDGSTDEEETERQAQLLMEMQRKEADFDVRKYFSSIVSSDTVKMYCHLLANYRENSAKVNHYIHSFFYRTKHFKIHEHEEWTMQPILFNIHVLLLFNKMLQDTYIQRLPEYKNFLDFIRGVVRDFFALAEKNQVLFVECLLRQSYASKACLLMQRNYDPIDSISRSRAEAVALGREQRIEVINQVRRQKIAMDHEELEGEAEFDFTLGPSDFQSSSLVENNKVDGGSTQDKEDGEAEFSVDPNALSTAPTSTQQPKKRAPRTRAVKERAKNWSKVEDRYLAKVFMKYRHLPSVYEVISYEDMFQDRDRTAEQIERRVKFLKLHRKTHDSSDDEAEQSNSDIGDDDDLGGTRGSRLDNDLATLDSSRPRRRLRRGEDLSDSDSDDDLLLGGGGLGTQPSQSATEVVSNGGNADAMTNGDNMQLAEDTQVIQATQDQPMLDGDESNSASKEQSDGAENSATADGESHEMEDTPVADTDPAPYDKESTTPSDTQATAMEEAMDGATSSSNAVATTGPDGETGADMESPTQDRGADGSITATATAADPVEPVATSMSTPMDTGSDSDGDLAPSDPATRAEATAIDPTEENGSAAAADDDDTPAPTDTEMQVSVTESTPTDAVNTEMAAATVDASQGEQVAAAVETEASNPFKRSRESGDAAGEADAANGSPAKKAHRAADEAGATGAVMNNQ